MTRAVALAMLLMLVGAAAQAQPTLCNRTAKPIEVAETEENKMVLQVGGRKRSAPDALVGHVYACYAHAPGADWEWVGDEDACLPGAQKRRFMAIENDSRKHTIELD